MPSLALYYPWMHFQSDEWVKLALLTWDGVVRVRAVALPPRDSDLVRQVQAESNLITDSTPTWRDLEVLEETFAQVLWQHGDEVAARLQRDPRFPMPPGNTGGDHAPDDPRSVWVYCGSETGDDSKISAGLRRDFVGNGLAIEKGDWLGMHPELGSIYLAVLADAMARHNALSPITDDPRVHRAPGSLDQVASLLLGEPVPAPALANAQHAYVHVALKAVIEPDRLAEVPVSKLLRFRERHTAELAAFRAHVAGLGEELASVAEIENLEVAHRHLEVIYQQQTEPQLTELRRALRGLGVESAAGALALRVDLTPGTAIAGVAALGGQLAMAGAALAVSAIPYVASGVRDRRARRLGSPVGYLLAADRELSGSRLLRALRPKAPGPA